MPSHPGTTPPQHAMASSTTLRDAPRVVLLGASNLTRGFAHVLRAASFHLSQPLQVYTAQGHGRSYGQASFMAFRALPGILTSRIWTALSSAPSPPTHALVTDIGNDLLYGIDPATVARWVGTCIDRLREYDARIVLTGLPLGSLRRTSAWNLALHKRLAFPFCRLSAVQLLEHATALDAALSELAASRDICWVEPSIEWYGFDPIHIRWSAQKLAWQTILASWHTAEADERQTPIVWPSTIRLWSLPPAERTLFRSTRHHAQPQWRGTQGATIALY